MPFDSFQEPRVIFKLVVEPVVVGRETHQNPRRLAVPRDGDCFLRAVRRQGWPHPKQVAASQPAQAGVRWREAGGEWIDRAFSGLFRAYERMLTSTARMSLSGRSRGTFGLPAETSLNGGAGIAPAFAAESMKGETNTELPGGGAGTEGGAGWDAPPKPGGGCKAREVQI